MAFNQGPVADISGSVTLRIQSFGLCFLFLIFFSLVAAAETSGSNIKIDLKDIQKDTKPKMEAIRTEPLSERSFFGQVRFENMQYLSEVPEAPQLTQSQLLSARLSGAGYLGLNPRLSVGVDVTAGTYFSRRHSHIYVNEAYSKYDFTSSKDISLGRRKFEWSEMDSRWQLGLWQPKFTLDALRPEDQGLTGVFYNSREEKSEFILMGTLIFIPTMGPEIREEGGSLVSDSRWYRQPSGSWEFNNQQTPIVYDLDVPDMGSLVSKPGMATMYRLGAKREGPRASASWAYKPVNDLLLKRQNFQVITTTEVKVSPAVTYHNLYSMDLGYAWSVVNASLSYTADSPDEKRPDPDWAIQKLKPVRIYSANLDFDLNRIFLRPMQIQTSYLRTYGGEIEDIDSAGEKDFMTLFDSRFKYTNAAMIKLQTELARPYSKPVISKFNYIYEFDQKGSIWGLEFQIYPTRSWGLVMGADLLGVEEETATDKRFINQFRANDRYYGGMSYVF